VSLVVVILDHWKSRVQALTSKGDTEQLIHQLFGRKASIHIPIQELGFDGVGYSSNLPSASRSVSMNTAARRIQII